MSGAFCCCGGPEKSELGEERLLRFLRSQAWRRRRGRRRRKGRRGKRKRRDRTGRQGGIMH